METSSLHFYRAGKQFMECYKSYSHDRKQYFEIAGAIQLFFVLFLFSELVIYKSFKGGNRRSLVFQPNLGIDSLAIKGKYQ